MKHNENISTAEILRDKKAIRFVIAGEIALIAAIGLTFTQCTGDRAHFVNATNEPAITYQNLHEHSLVEFVGTKIND